MKFFQFLSVSLVALAIGGSPALANDKPSATTHEFVKNAAISSSFEIASSKLALEKSKNAAVKEFAQKMIADHSAADKKLKATLATEGLSPALAPATLDEKHQKIYDDLKMAKNFDAEYISAQTDAHAEAVSLFTDYSTKGDNASLKSFAKETLPTLKQHKEHVEELKS